MLSIWQQLGKSFRSDSDRPGFDNMVISRAFATVSLFDMYTESLF